MERRNRADTVDLAQSKRLRVTSACDVVETFLGFADSRSDLADRLNQG